jgi:hypothetical protein
VSSCDEAAQRLGMKDPQLLAVGEPSLRLLGRKACAQASPNSTWWDPSRRSLRDRAQDDKGKTHSRKNAKNLCGKI